MPQRWAGRSPRTGVRGTLTVARVELRALDSEPSRSPTPWEGQHRKGCRRVHSPLGSGALPAPLVAGTSGGRGPLCTGSQRRAHHTARRPGGPVQAPLCHPTGLVHGEKSEEHRGREPADRGAERSPVPGAVRPEPGPHPEPCQHPPATHGTWPLAGAAPEGPRAVDSA